MKLQFLAISDAHLGEDTSLLTYPLGRQRVWEALRCAFADGDEQEKLDEKNRFNVKEVILIGDFPDRCLSSTVDITVHTTHFMRMLGSAAEIEKGIFIPGNHEHTLWTNYIRKKLNLSKDAKYPSAITNPEGELLVKQGQVHTEPLNAEELLTIFFGYPRGSLWRSIEQQKFLDFVVANPIYAKTFNGRTYVFTHGTHFRRDVTLPKLIKRLADWSQADKFAGLEVESDVNVKSAEDLEDLERRVTPFVDTLWPSSGDNPNNRSDRLWYLLNLISGKFNQHRDTPPFDCLYPLSALPNAPSKRIKKLVSSNNSLLDKSLQLWREFFADHMFEFLKDHNLQNPDMTFVFGDTHRGGYGDWHSNGQNVRFYNTGGWGTTNENNHPACHIFAVDSEGEEYLLDVSFEDVKMFGEPLVKVASKDAEDRHSAIGKSVRFFLEHMLPD